LVLHADEGEFQGRETVVEVLDVNNENVRGTAGADETRAWGCTTEEDIASYEEHGFYVSPVIVPGIVLDRAEHGMDRFYRSMSIHLQPLDNRYQDSPSDKEVHGNDLDMICRHVDGKADYTDERVFPLLWEEPCG
jgi:hypothetical protein